MRSCTIPWLGVAFVAAAIGALSPQGVAAEKPAAQTPKAYSSPRAVFDAYRQAVDKQDWRTEFFCWTPELRDNGVFEAFFGSNMHLSNPKVLAVLKKYGVETSAVEAEYDERYREKHGVNIAKTIADQEKAAAKTRPSRTQQKETQAPEKLDRIIPGPPDDRGPPLPSVDEDLFRKVVSARVTDKAGFYEAANKILANQDSPPRIGKLENVSIQGDTATGRVSETFYHIEFPTGRGPGPLTKAGRARKVSNTVTRTVYFRKSEGGWLIDSSDEDKRALEAVNR